MNPPPEPSRPPTVPPKIPHREQSARFIRVHSIEASQTDSVLPFILLILLSLYSLTASYPNTPNAIGNFQTKRKRKKKL